MKKRIIKILMNAIHDGLEDDEVLLLYSIVGKVRETFIDFETEYQLKEFREIEKDHFDKNGNAYKHHNSPALIEQMLKLINQLESELK